MNDTPAWVTLAVRDVLSDVTDRRGLRQALDQCDQETLDAMEGHFKSLVSCTSTSALAVDAILCYLRNEDNSFAREWDQVDAETQHDIRTQWETLIQRRRETDWKKVTPSQDRSERSWEREVAVKLWDGLWLKAGTRKIVGDVALNEREQLLDLMADMIRRNKNTTAAANGVLSLLLLEMAGFHDIYYGLTYTERMELLRDWNQMILAAIPKTEPAPKDKIFKQDTGAFYQLPVPEQQANLYAHARYPLIDAGLTAEQQAWELRSAWLKGCEWQKTQTPLDNLGPKDRLMYDLNAIVDMWDDNGISRADTKDIIGSVLSLIDGEPYDDDLPSGPGYYLIPKSGPLNAEFDLSGSLAYLWDEINT
jgi:hypothetical protein